MATIQAIEKPSHSGTTLGTCEPFTRSLHYSGSIVNVCEYMTMTLEKNFNSRDYLLFRVMDDDACANDLRCQCVLQSRLWEWYVRI